MRVPLDLEAKVRLARARRSPQLALTATDFPHLLRQTRETLFPSVRHSLESYFVQDGPLACVCHDERRAIVFIHAILNHHRTPDTVFQFIAVHELLHLVIPSRVVEGVVRQHPPEFWVHELSLVPNRDAAWEWLWTHCDAALKIDADREGILVTRNWRAVWRRLNRPGEEWMPENARLPPVHFL